MKLLIKKKPRDLWFNRPSRKEIKLTILSLFALTFQISTAAPSKSNSSNTIDLALVQKIVKGKVTDASGLPLPGVNVLIKGTTIGVQTDYNGEFAIEVAANQTVLVISYMGMQEQEVTIGKGPIVVTLKEAGEVMDEVVIVGYSKIKKKVLLVLYKPLIIKN
ncbi:carboxypeptidase-like regulatory domain-containing protein [Flavobacterium sp. 140616W15]|uniref:carboxypeptidase-like regulatory domain-containing protein n=1 Tax=Flavobacterium sp. 140616W15 TaxID=2478552 RepID=UPI001F5CB309|nr:carboxypeptidase-like regulatory domain-containing protein [Flavobacterium sp. 140616W15]